MLYEELKSRTNGECTHEEYEAVNAVYMTLDDMTKEQAAKLWHQLYAKRHAAAKKEAEAKSHSLAYLNDVTSNTINGQKVELPNGSIIRVEWDARYIRRQLRDASGDIIARSDYDNKLVPSLGNPARLTA